jgi:hypothetical protein
MDDGRHHDRARAAGPAGADTLHGELGNALEAAKAPSFEASPREIARGSRRMA